MLTVDLTRLNPVPGSLILDIGCGSGRHTGAAAKFSQVSVVGADIAFEELQEANKRLRLQEQFGEAPGRWSFLAADISRLPFDDELFDLIICSEILEHLRDQKAAVRELYRILKPGKNIAVSVPSYWPEKLCWKISEAYASADNGHVRIYKKKELIALLKDAGIKPWAFHYAHSIHTPYWWLKCLAGLDGNSSKLVDLYHRFLTWDIMKRPRLTHMIDRLLNPVLGKSLVIYAKKP